MALSTTNNLSKLLNASLAELQLGLRSDTHTDLDRFAWYVAARARLAGESVHDSKKTAAENYRPERGFGLAIPFPLCLRQTPQNSCLGLIGAMPSCGLEPNVDSDVLDRAMAVFRQAYPEGTGPSLHVPENRIDGDSFTLAALVAGLVASQPDLMTSRTVPFLADFAATGSWHRDRFAPVDASSLAAKGAAMRSAGLSKALVVEGQKGMEALRDLGLDVVEIPQEIGAAKQAIVRFLTANERSTEKHQKRAIALINQLRFDTLAEVALAADRVVEEASADRQLANALVDELVQSVGQGPAWEQVYAGIVAARRIDDRNLVPMATPYLRKKMAEAFKFGQLVGDANCLRFTPWHEYEKGGCEIRFGRYPVTEADWALFDPRFRARRPAHPMVDVTWLQAVCMAWWCGCSLPTRNEWLWRAQNQPERRKFRPILGHTMFGRTLPPTRYDHVLGGEDDEFCRDMLGNVWEWCDEVVDENALVLGGCFESEPVAAGFPVNVFRHTVAASNIGFRLIQRRPRRDRLPGAASLGGSP